MYEKGDSKTYCMKGKHVIGIVVAVVVVGLAVGLGVGLTYPEPCKITNGDATKPPASSTTTSVPSTTRSLPSTTRSLPSSTVPSQDSEACPVENNENGDWSQFRLPSYIYPLHYDVEIQPELDKDTYNGTVTIWLKLTRTGTKHLWLHIRENRIIAQPRLRDRNNQEISIKHCFEFRRQEYLVLEANQELHANANDESLDDTYRLTLQFAGQLNGSLVGFYRTTYQENGVTK